MKRGASTSKGPVSRSRDWGRPLHLFPVLLAVNALFSYATLPATTRVVLEYIFLILFLAVVLWTRRGKPVAPRSSDALKDPKPFVPILLFLALAAALSFKLTTFSAWPVYDEGISALYAMDNMDGWDGRLHYYFSALPPLYLWALAVLFKILGPGKTALWLMPALLVFLSMLLLHASARRFLRPAEALLIPAFGGFGFWAMYAARFSHSYVLVLFWGSLCLYAATIAADPRCRRPVPSTLLLGTLLGCGFHTFYSWPVAAAAIVLLFLYLLGRPRLSRQGAPILTCLFLPMILLALPSLLNLAGGTYQGWLAGLLNLSTSLDVWVGRSISVTSLFWEPMIPFSFGPAVGGLLNPVEGALVLLGVLEVARHPRPGPFRLLAALFLLLLAPAFLTLPLNHTRMIQLLPLCLFLSVAGLRSMLPGLRHPGRWIAGIWILSLTLNMAHLWGPARDWCTRPNLWEHQRRIEHKRAFDILEKTAREQGPGRLLMRLDSGTFDFPRLNPSLYVLSHPWNVLCNATLDPSSARWVALYTNAYHQRHLQRLLPGGAWFPLSDPPARFHADYVLGVYPAESVPPGTLLAWENAERFLYDLYRWKLDDPRFARAASSLGAEYLTRLRAHRELFAADEFLDCVYREKILSVHTIQKIESNTGELIREGLEAPYRSPYLLTLAGLRALDVGDRKTGLSLLREAAPAHAKAREILDEIRERR